jgi:hypothetical protein
MVRRLRAGAQADWGSGYVPTALHGRGSRHRCWFRRVPYGGSLPVGPSWLRAGPRARHQANRRDQPERIPGGSPREPVLPEHHRTVLDGILVTTVARTVFDLPGAYARCELSGRSTTPWPASWSACGRCGPWPSSSSSTGAPAAPSCASSSRTAAPATSPRPAGWSPGSSRLWSEPAWSSPSARSTWAARGGWAGWTTTTVATAGHRGRQRPAPHLQLGLLGSERWGAWGGRKA